jgi:transcriptional regulator with AAA-type ATPase domain
MYTSLLTMEDSSMVIPGGDEDIYDEIIELLGETEWVGNVKQLTATVKPVIYKLFGHEPKAPVVK